MELTFSARRIAVFLSWLALPILLTSFIVRWLNHYVVGGSTIEQLDHFINMQRATELPAWYAAAIMFACTLVFITIAQTKEARRGVFIGHWRGLAFLTLGIAIDKIFGFHRWALQIIQQVSHIQGVEIGAWLLLGASVVLVAYYIYTQFFHSIGRGYSRQLAYATGLFLAGTVGVNLLGPIAISALRGSETLGLLLPTFQEGLQIAGAVMLLFTLVEYTQELNTVLNVQIAHPAAAHKQRAASRM